MSGNGRSDVPRYVAGLAGMAVSLVFLATGTRDPPVTLASLFFLAVCATDTLFSRIPNPLNLALLGGGILYNVHHAGAPGLATAAGGFVVGLSLLLIPWLLGGVGAGDVKALAALGALVGPGPVLQTFLYVALIGGMLAVLHCAFAGNLKEKGLQGGRALRAFALTGDAGCLRPAASEDLRFPYAAAIALGFFAYVQWGGLV